jgi:hypothetical protein
MATLGRAPADEILVARARRHERRCRTIQARYFVIARSIAADDEWIAPFARPVDIDPIGSRPFANLSDIEDFAHDLAFATTAPIERGVP